MTDIWNWLSGITLAQILAALGISGTMFFGYLAIAGKSILQIFTAATKAKEAAAEDTKTEARKDNLLMNQIEALHESNRSLTERVASLETKQATTEKERDAAIGEAKSYSEMYEALQNEFTVMKSDYSRQEERIGKLEKTTIELRAGLDAAVGERDKLAQELETERKSKLELEKVAEKERHQHVVELTRRDTKIEVLEKSVEDLRDDLRHVLKEAVATASESSEPPRPEAVEKAQESSETLTQE